MAPSLARGASIGAITVPMTRSLAPRGAAPARRRNAGAAAAAEGGAAGAKDAAPKLTAKEEEQRFHEAYQKARPRNLHKGWDIGSVPSDFLWAPAARAPAWRPRTPPLDAQTHLPPNARRRSLCPIYATSTARHLPLRTCACPDPSAPAPSASQSRTPRLLGPPHLLTRVAHYAHAPFFEPAGVHRVAAVQHQPPAAGAAD